MWCRVGVIWHNSKDNEGKGWRLASYARPPKGRSIREEEWKSLGLQGMQEDTARLLVGVLHILSGSPYPSLVGVPWTRKLVDYVALARGTLR